MSTRPTTPSRRPTRSTASTSSPTKPKASTSPSKRNSKLPPPVPDLTGVDLDSLHPILPRQLSLPCVNAPLKSPRQSKLDQLQHGTGSGGEGLGLGRSGTVMKAKRGKKERRESDDPETSLSVDGGSGETSEEESGSEEEKERERPVRKAGFGSRKENVFQVLERDEDDLFAVRSPVRDEEGMGAGMGRSRAGSLKGVAGRAAGKVVEDEDGKRENVVVCLRIRPTRTTDSSEKSKNIYKLSPESGRLSLDVHHPILLKRGAMTKNSSSNLAGGASAGAGVGGEYDFAFDALHLHPSPTGVLYDQKIRPVVRAAMEGFNGTVFAYGQTASGKTHTMMGTDNEPGIIPLAVDELFDYIVEQNTHRTFSLRVSILEIYNESIRDLLLPPPSHGGEKPKPLEVHGEEGYVKGLVERPVAIPAEVMVLLEEGEKRRRTGMTDWNERSSRSHCVFIVTIESLSKEEDGGVARTSRLNLIDLAGSESATGQEERRKEGSFINKSLLTLGTVIAKLTETKSSGIPPHIPYRDSKLTRLLQPALSGNSRVAIICTISPDKEHAAESLSTLKFAKRAKMVVTKAERGVLLTDQMMLKLYAKEVETLQAKISAAEDGDLVRARDSAMAQVDELQSRSRKAEDSLAQKELELTLLRKQLQLTQSLILTGPVIEANERRVSGQFEGLLKTPARGKRRGSEMGLGLGTPRAALMRGTPLARVVSEVVPGSPRVGTVEKEIALEVQLEQAQAKLSTLSLKDDEITTLRTELDSLKLSSAAVQLDLETRSAEKEKLQLQITSLQTNLDSLRFSNDESSSKLAALSIVETELVQVKKQLTESNSRIEQLLVAQSQLTLSKDELTTSIKDLENKLVESEKRVREVEGVGKKEIGAAKKALKELKAKLVEAERKIVDKEEEVKGPLVKASKMEKELAELRTRLEEMESTKDAEGEAAEERLRVVTREKDEAFKKLKGELESSLEKMDLVAKERDAALLSIKALEDRLTGMEERLVELSMSHEMALKDVEQEKELAIFTAREEVAQHASEVSLLTTDVADKEQRIVTLSNQLTERDDKITTLQRNLDVYLVREQQKNSLSQSQKAGTDSVRSRLAGLQVNRSDTPTPTSSRAKRSTGLASSLGSANTASTSRKASGSSSEIDQEFKVTQLQVENAGYLAKIAQLERQTQMLAQEVESSRGGSSSQTMSKGARRDEEEVTRIGALLEEKERALVKAHLSSEDWAKKYHASQRLLQTLISGAASKSLHSSSSSTSSHSHLEQENIPTSRPLLTPLNLPVPPSLTAHMNGPTSPDTRHRASSLHAAPYVPAGVPPPLPCSPRMKEKERRMRRETIDRDMAQLRGVKSVERTKEKLESPSASPAKGFVGSPGPLWS